METIQLTAAPTTSAYRSRVFALCMLVYIFSGTVSTLMSTYLPVVVRDLLGQADQAELDRVSAYVGATFLYGWMLGGMSFGYFGDRLGRVRSLVGAVVLYGGCTLLTAFAPNWLTVVLRFATGFGIGGVLVLTTVIVSEIWPERNRPVAMGILAVAFPVGIMLSGWVNNLISDWRQAFWIGGIPLVVGALIAGLVQEPAGWKRVHQQTADANVSLFDPQYRRSLWLGSLAFGAMLVGLWAVFSWVPTWVQSLVVGDARKARGLSMMLMGSGGVLGGILSGFIFKRVGHRRTMLFVFAACFVMAAVVFKTNTTLSPIVYLEMATLAVLFGISQGTMSAYLPELFPTPLRGRATGFCFNIGRLVTATAVLFIGTLVAVLGGYGSAIFAFSGTFVIGFIATWRTKPRQQSALTAVEDPVSG
ncbi:MFS transporter [Larkinella punicea]|uniref:MFS transporter n=1 Tax=Larkinella punicea TaxID=2315727 RepID=A0A368JV79_9BACT|nr:MFS transporter [Larkinella punicea]RCR70503.1 MFS transporter [Larkinella punicea]